MELLQNEKHILHAVSQDRTRSHDRGQPLRREIVTSPAATAALARTPSQTTLANHLQKNQTTRRGQSSTMTENAKGEEAVALPPQH
ncbi:uncharacterized protein HKW66_Vig0020460 [Vigna angularis]|uniref:Uncharacterized protein n=1 Tax=Phaseolus angularis TaxID=3914 RepID=A0A8T0L5I5_PHAAN|nr:uncharacterized protein HKW66_Vig0020460 [Vigna angularis]